MYFLFASNNQKWPQTSWKLKLDYLFLIMYLITNKINLIVLAFCLREKLKSATFWKLPTARYRQWLPCRPSWLRPAARKNQPIPERVRRVTLTPFLAVPKKKKLKKFNLNTQNEIFVKNFLVLLDYVVPFHLLGWEHAALWSPWRPLVLCLCFPWLFHSWKLDLSRRHRLHAATNSYLLNSRKKEKKIGLSRAIYDCTSSFVPWDAQTSIFVCVPSSTFFGMFLYRMM